MPLPKSPKKIELWKRRQSIAQMGKKQSKEHIENRRISLMTGLHRANTVICANCRKELKRIPCRAKGRNYCDARCQMNYEYTNGIRDPAKIMTKFHLIGRELAKEGKHPFQQSEVKVKSNRELGRRNYGGSRLEERFSWIFKILRINTKSQFRIKFGKDVLNRDRYYFVDFAIPSLRLAIECDEAYWHRDKKRERKRQNRIENLGWKMVRFKAEEIQNDLVGCALKLVKCLNN